MNTSPCECSSGCESGWTTYLDHLSNSTHPRTHTHKQAKGGRNVVHDRYNRYQDDDEDDGDEDLSMVSDASSGPPHLHGGGESAPPPPQQGHKLAKTRDTKLMIKNKKKQRSLCLDDTASSHFSQGIAVSPENHHSISTTHFEEERIPKKKMGFFKSSGSLLGRKRQ